METKLREALNKCSRCGTCQAKCPLYQTDGREIVVARSKMELLDRVFRGEIQWNDSLENLFSLCLQCGACSDNCPNGVEPHRLIAEARFKLVEEGYISPLKQGIFRHLLPHRGRMDLAAKMLHLYQHFGVRKVLRGSGLLRGLNLDKLEGLLPESAGGPLTNTSKHGGDGLKIAYFMGCMTNLFFHETGEAVISILESQGAKVVIPPQYCCGMPALFSGDATHAKILVEKNIKAFSGDYDYIITDCASCLSALKQYGEISAGGSGMAAKAMDFSHLLVDVLDFHPKVLGTKGVPVTYHDPCHLKRQTRGREAPRTLLERLSPAYTYVEAADDGCCGSAGSFYLSHYDLAKKVGERKGEALARTGAKVIATSCPSCLMQLRHVMEKDTRDFQVEHIATLCYRAMTENNN